MYIHLCISSEYEYKIAYVGAQSRIFENRFTKHNRFVEKSFIPLLNSSDNSEFKNEGEKIRSYVKLKDQY